MKILDIKRNKKGQFLRTWAKHRIKKECLVCKKKFETIESRIKEGKGKYCSKECFFKVPVSRETRLRLSKLYKGKRYSPTTEFKKGHIPWIKGKHLPCKTKGLPRPHIRGKNHPLWKGGQKRYKHLCTIAEYKNWRESVFERDNYTCQVCGKKGAYIEAHHKKSWAHYPMERYLLENGVTLCRDCHKKTNNYKGRGLNVSTCYRT